MITDRCRRCRCPSGTTRTARDCARPTSRTSPACGDTATGSGQTPRGSYVIYGRSDSTLNRGGVRMGTAEFYRGRRGFPRGRRLAGHRHHRLGAAERGRAAVLPRTRHRVRHARRASSPSCARCCAPSCRRDTFRPLHRHRRGPAHAERQEVRGPGQSPPGPPPCQGRRRPAPQNKKNTSSRRETKRAGP